MTARTAPGAPAGWEPDRDEARRLIEEELARPEYAQAEPNPLLEWLGGILSAALEWLGTLGGAAPSLPGWVLPLILVAVAVVVLVLLRPRATAAARARRADAVLSDRTVTPEQHRRMAETAFAAGDHGAALVAWFRALVRHAEERTVLDPRPGRTATEAAHGLGTAFTTERRALEAAADAFNAVVYGDRPTTAARATNVRDLDARLATMPPDTTPPGPLQGAAMSGRMVAPR
ncbi:DUF4129 domain-containing protein [Citricoccus sp.]|uniref:DUF4129 domain-containing protein n=1 Tax=Citricoccus sp. TaxID=1978372 RepID=UPI0028BD934F|nr:DUF4129 domain-containing protein [Citricoccus sp.]